MSQHDYNIANGGGAAVRADINNALAAILSQNSGATAPTTTKPFMLWYDTTTGVLKMRNAADTAWIAAIDGVTGSNPQGMKNRIINGAMVIDQRNAGASFTVTTNGQYTLDRWQAGSQSSSAFSVQQSSTAPAGFKNSLLITSLAATTISSGSYFSIQQMVEGFNCSDLGWGTADAQPVTISFRVRSSLTGTFSGCVQNANVDRSYPFTYTISAANTWETKTITIAGDTSGTWATNNTAGLMLLFSLGMGSTRNGTVNSWQTGNYRGVTGSVDLVATSGATWYVTGVQLEKGSIATAFDYRPYGTELALCQRYFYKLVGGGSGNLFPSIGSGHCASATLALATVQLPVTMRSSATASYNGTLSVNSGGVDYAITSLGILYGYGSNQWVTLNVSGGGMTTGRGCIAYCAASTNDWFQLSSEL